MGIVFQILQILSALFLIGLIAVQTTKSEGLGGTIGGKTETSFSKAGFDDKIDDITKWAAISFLVISFLVAYII